MHADLQHLLAKDLLTDVTAVPLTDLRDLRVRCSAAEGDISFVRRLAQGRLDIVGHEVRRRSGVVDARPDITGILFDLPEIMSEARSGPSGGRLLAILEPGVVAQALIDRLDQAASPGELSGLEQLDTDRLATLLDTLRDFEVSLSATRRRLHERIDLIQGEIARRYRDGEASIESLLN
ncbi:MAG: hypothetical protein ACFCVK_21525 [Acidimicrobiales bacterium]